MFGPASQFEFVMLQVQQVKCISTLVWLKNTIHFNVPGLVHWGIAIEITYKLQLLLYKIGFLYQKRQCIFPPTFRSLQVYLNS